MKITQRPIIRILVLLLLALAINACDSNDDGTQNKPVASLSMPSSIEIAPANNNSGLQLTSQELVNRLIPRGAVAITDPGTDFSTDKTFTISEDAAKQHTDLTNYLLCLIDMLSYTDKVNQGPYNIVINLKSCYENIFPGIAGYFDGSIFIIEGTVESIRSNNTSPHIISAWLFFQFDKQNGVNSAEIQSQMLMEISIYHNVSPAYPYGHFEINLADVEDAGKRGGIVGEEFRTSKSTYRSYLINNLPIYQSASYDDYSDNSGGNIEVSATSALLTNDTRDVGALRYQWSSRESDPLAVPQINDKQSTLMEFNQNYILSSQFANTAQITTNALCLSRNAFRDKYWSYNLYYSTDGQFRGKTVSAGQRVDLTSGVDFRYQGSYGRISRDWQWLENDSILPDGAAISSLDDNRQYTAHVAYGRMKKYSRNSVPLSEFQGRPLRYWGKHPNTTSFYSYWVIKVDTTTNEFVIDKIIITTSSGETEATTFDDDYDPNTPEIDVAATLTLPDGEMLTFYEYFYTNTYTFVYDSTIPQENRSAIKLASKNLNITNTSLFPSTTTEIPLYCYFDCPLGGLTQNDIDAASFRSELNHPDNSSTPWQYTLKIDGFKMLLYDKSNNMAVDVSNLDLSKFNISAIRSGKMSTNPIPVTNVTRFELDQLNEAYDWSTGSQFYSQTITLTDAAGEILEFDNPIEIQYTHDAANDINNTDPNTNIYQGKTFSLTYDNNFLTGLPYGNVSSTDFSYEISLADGTLLSSNEGDFVTRAKLISKQLQIKPIEQCNNFNLEPLLNNESLTLIPDTEIPDVPFTASDRPTVNSPAIISR